MAFTAPHERVTDDVEPLDGSGGAAIAAEASGTRRSDGLDRLRRASERAVVVAALLLLPVLLVERSGAPHWQALAQAADWAIWSVFAFDLLLLLLPGTPRHRRRWIPLDVAIVVLSFPLLPHLLAATRLVRLGRLGPAIRILAALRLVMVSTRAGLAIHRLTRRRGLRLVAAMTLLLWFGAAGAFVLVEPAEERFVDGLWWAVVTLTTVGYGDLFPVTPVGRLLAIVLMVGGIGFVAVLTASVAAHFVEDDGREVLAALRRVEERLAALEARLDAAGGLRPDRS